MAGLGLSFGINNQKTTTNSAITKNETTDQSQVQNQAQTQTSSSKGTSAQTGSTAQSGTSATTQAGATTSAGTTAQQQAQTTQLFSDPTLAGIQGAVGHLLDTVGLSTNAQNAGVSKLGGFDPNAFVSEQMQGATAKAQSTLDTQLGQLFDSIGGSESTNSAAMLLANRARGDMASNLAGIQGQLTGEGQQIQQGNIAAGNAVDQTQEGFLTNLLNTLKGGTATSTGATVGTQAQTGSTAQTGTTATSESGTSAQNASTTQDTSAQLVSLLTTLLHGTDNTVGTEDTTTNTKKSGGGLSLAL